MKILIKNHSTVLLALACVVFVISCKTQTRKGANGVTYHTAQEYNDFIVGRQTKLVERVMDFVKVSQTDLDAAEVLLDTCVKEAHQMANEIKGMSPFKNDSTLRDAAVSIFGFYEKIFDKDYRVLIHLKKEQDGTSMEIENRIREIVTKVTEEEKGFDNRFRSAQQAFASKNKLLLQENDIQKKFEKKIN